MATPSNLTPGIDSICGINFIIFLPFCVWAGVIYIINTMEMIEAFVLAPNTLYWYQLFVVRGKNGEEKLKNNKLFSFHDVAMSNLENCI